MSGLLAAIDECASVGSDIVSMSLGGSGSSNYERQEMQKNFDEDGMLLIAAAGNGGPNAAKSYPASYDSVISVAAVDSSANHVSFSQINDQVELAAPGKIIPITLLCILCITLLLTTYPIFTLSMISQEEVSGRLFHLVDTQTTMERQWPRLTLVV